MIGLIVLQGVVLGLSIAAPVGPIAMLCIRRTLLDGWRYGMIAGLGAATADALYGCIAAFGLTLIANVLLAHQRWLGLGGGLFLCYLGAKTLVAQPTTQLSAVQRAGLLRTYGTTFALTLSNPLTILSFAAIVTGLGATTSASSYGDAGVLVMGVFVGSMLWWICLSSAVSLLRIRMTVGSLRWISLVSGVVMLGFGILALVRLE
jgi:threonine/homoserine/homoserine lactone efflux protein